MFEISNHNLIAVSVALTLVSVPSGLLARDNTLIGGVSTGFDYDDRRYDDNGNSDDDYQRLFLSPLLRFTSLSERDSFTLQANPRINYDVKDSNTDWDSNLRAAADRFMTQQWQLGISNNYLVSDRAEDEDDYSGDSEDPRLSENRGRRRYWRNTLNMFSNHFYREDSLIGMRLGYIVLRNDDNNDDNEEYDRYSAGLRNEHRYNAFWATTANFQFIVGDFKDNNSPGELSDDIKEYRFLFALDNTSIANNRYRIGLSYTAARYDDSDQDDDDVLQMRLSWRRDISPRMYTNFGVGPSYSKVEGQKADYGGNGIAEVNYAVERGSINFQAEKRYDVENFSGYNQSGLADIWEARLSGSYRLQDNLTWTGRLSYRYEDREEPSGDSNNLDNYHEDRYIAGTGLSYNFLPSYTASVRYTFTKNNSDRSDSNDDYDDHRVLLTLSWQNELLNW